MASVDFETATSTSVESARNLLTQYEDQILNGCNNASCTEVLCRTGRLNGSQKPVRAYTARSARAIALTVCSGPNPRAHLCPHRVDRDSGPRLPSSEPRDPSALIQLLGDTKAVSQLLRSPNAGEDMRGRHQALEQLAMRANGQTPIDRLSSAELVGALLPEFDVLLESMSTQRLAVLEMVDREIVSKGFACPANLQSKPSDESWNSWQVILSRVNDESYQRLFRHIIKIIGARMKLEGLQQPSQRDKTSPRLPETSGRGVIEVLARRLIDRGNDQDNTAFAVVIWLKRLFADMWDGQPAITQYAGPHVLLELLQEIQHQAKSMPDDAFNMLMIRLRIADMELAQSWAAHVDSTTKHILEYRYLFEPDQLVMCFRAVHLLSMSQAHSEAVKHCEYRRRRDLGHAAQLEWHSAQLRYQEQHYLLLYVSRERILKDAFDQLWQRRAGELRRPLRVRMGADELDIGHDLGQVDHCYAASFSG